MDLSGQGWGVVIAHLRAAAHTVDLLWNDALAEPSGEAAMALGQASQAIHRALIALTATELPPGRSAVYAAEW
jgi:hypothetical protein